MALAVQPAELGFPSFWRVSHWGECLACGSIAARSSQGEGQDAVGRRRPGARDSLLLAFARQVPYVPLRHGLLAPFSLVVINDLAHGRGLLARFLSWRGFGRLSEASFSLFALQMPAGVWFCVATLSSATGTTAHLVAMIAWTLGLAVVWVGTCATSHDRAVEAKDTFPADRCP